MPKYNNKVIKHYHAEVTKNVRHLYNRKEKKEFADWTADKEHINWNYLTHINRKKATAEIKFSNRKEKQYYYEIQQLEKQRDKLLFEGINTTSLNEEEINRQTRKRPQKGKVTAQPVLTQKIIEPIELPETTDDEDYKDENERQNRTDQ